MAKSTCSIEGCGKPCYGRGYCSKHYQRLRANGDPLAVKFNLLPRGSTVGERFWAKVDAEGDCWLWTAALNPKGYGIFRAGRGVKTQGAHRWAWELLIGPIPESMTIDHRCLVRHCVNVAHLELVTQAENARRGFTARLRREQTHCLRGHEFSGWNLIVRPAGGRMCRACNAEWKRKKKAVNRALQLECPQGHLYAGDNLMIDSRGRKYCRTCRKAA